MVIFYEKFPNETYLRKKSLDVEARAIRISRARSSSPAFTDDESIFRTIGGRVSDALYRVIHLINP